jgi:hypothetical protein
METVVGKNGKKIGVGCWFDSARGPADIAKEVQGEAKAAGWEWEGEAEENILSEHFFFAWDEAEVYLNEHVAPEYYCFGSNDNGDWGLWQMNCEDNGDKCDWRPNAGLVSEDIAWADDYNWGMPVFCQSCGRGGTLNFRFNAEDVIMQEGL